MKFGQLKIKFISVQQQQQRQQTLNQFFLQKFSTPSEASPYCLAREEMGTDVGAEKRLYQLTNIWCKYFQIFGENIVPLDICDILYIPLGIALLHIW